MGDKTVLPISKTDANELRIKLERGDPGDQREACESLADLLYEAVHCPADMTWLNPSTQEV